MRVQTASLRFNSAEKLTLHEMETLAPAAVEFMLDWMKLRTAYKQDINDVGWAIDEQGFMCALVYKKRMLAPYFSPIYLCMPAEIGLVQAKRENQLSDSLKKLNEQWP